MPDWLIPVARWVQLHGVPRQALNLNTLTEVYKPFRRFCKVKEGERTSENRISIRVLVQDCDLLKIPHFSPLSFEGSNIPVRIVPENMQTTMTDVNTREGEHMMWHSSHGRMW